MLRLGIFLFWQEFALTVGLKVIDNGIGPIVFGAEEKMVDYAVLTEDPIADLPDEVIFKKLNIFSFSPPQFTICSSTTWDALTTNVAFFQLQRDSGSPWMSLVMASAGTHEAPIYRITVK